MSNDYDAQDTTALNSRSAGGVPDDLVPARYQADARRTFAPNRRWGLVALVLGSIVGFFAIQIYGRYRAREALREELLARYAAEASPTAAEVGVFVERLNRWVSEAGREGANPTTFATDGFRWSEMHDWRGLYLRIEAEDTLTDAAIAASAREMGRDAITRCLGVSPVSARGLYELAQFLEPAWVEAIRTEEDTMTLRVLEDEMNRRLLRDVPLVRSMLRSHYFLLVVTRGGRWVGTVDAYVYDLERDALLMSTRTRASGRLLPVRIGEGRGPWPSELDLGRSGAQDCSIAGNLRAVAGEPVGIPQEPEPGPEDIVAD
jgi:hypothetical protein